MSEANFYIFVALLRDRKTQHFIILRERCFSNGVLILYAEIGSQGRSDEVVRLQRSIAIKQPKYIKKKIIISKSAPCLSLDFTMNLYMYVLSFARKKQNDYR